MAELSAPGNGDLAVHEPTEVEAADAHQVQERIRAGIGAMRKLWIGLAADLHTFREHELWRSLGYSSFEAWLATPEIDLERAQVYQLMAIHQELVLDRGVDPDQLGELPVRRVRQILPAVRRGHVTVEEALADAEALPPRDLEHRYRQMTVRPPNDPETPIDPETEPEYATCPACGSRYEVRKT